MNYKVETVTRIQEGASWEDIENGDAYETAYIVYDENGEIIWDTTNYENVKPYIEITEQEKRKEIKELGVGEYIHQYKNDLTKEDLYKLLLHFDFAVQNFCRHYVGMSKEDYDTIIDNMNDGENMEFVDDYCYGNEED